MKVGVVGAGLAGLSAACALADAGHRVVLLERRPWAGGKTYSFTDRRTGDDIDNGQHILMRCTTAYVEFLRRIGSLDRIRWQPRLAVPVLDAGGRRADITAARLPAPLHLAPSLLGYRHLSLADRARVFRGAASMLRSGPDRADQAFGDWLRRRGQTGRLIRSFWDLFVVPTLNCPAEEADVAQALFVFRTGFLRSPDASAIGLPQVGLSDLHVRPSLRYVEERGGAFLPGAAVEGVETCDRRVLAVHLRSGERIEADAWVLAVPPAEALGLLPEPWRGREPFRGLRAFRTAPIVNVHLWFDGPVFPYDFAAFVGCDLQWVFNQSRIRGVWGPEGAERLVVSLSDARRHVAVHPRALVDRLVAELRRAVPGVAAQRLLRWKVIKEPHATFVPEPGLRRPGPETPMANLVLAGAYTDSGWPATMESAVRSGLAAAAAIERRRAALERVRVGAVA